MRVIGKQKSAFKEAITLHMGTSLDEKGLPKQTPNRDAFEAAQTNFLSRPIGVPGNPTVANDVANASVDNVEFWWNFVRLENDVTIIQYSQAIMLRFGGIVWPHFTGATLTLRNVELENKE